MAIAPAARRLRHDPDAVFRGFFASAAGQPRRPAAIAGLEQEYAVWLRGGTVDFQDLIDRVVPTRALRRFAFDENARIVASGAVWTVDSPHAEVATPPRRLQAGIASRLARDALAERSALRRRLPTGAELRGYSTHVNAFADGRRRLGPGAPVRGHVCAGGHAGRRAAQFPGPARATKIPAARDRHRVPRDTGRSGGREPVRACRCHRGVACMQGCRRQRWRRHRSGARGHP